ncbi:hypothetical protein HELRODRAFT_162895 [Helobdella robusta]|uniref:Uncharacterized protein n=1 Tax=Helobdella robusta TaxID=6412 RepID=T1ETC1_HELRO|nr:hypothetical protein HELRODRAFT_162895 [Helobdella robusta]ESN99362.1 hypothetical protein HELRODRAFT_162895 [Helobdella robusta]
MSLPGHSTNNMQVVEADVSSSSEQKEVADHVASGSQPVIIEDDIADNLQVTAPEENGQTANSNILYPVAIKRKGRPAKRKQLFQHRKLTFEKLRPSAQDQLRLSCVSSEVTAKHCVQTNCIASINDVKEIIDPRCTDDRANMSTLKRYFSNEAWTKLENKMWSIGQNLYVCVVCGHHSGRDNQTRTSWVQCDGCIN